MKQRQAKRKEKKRKTKIMDDYFCHDEQKDWRVTALDIITQEANVDCMKMPFCGHPMHEQSLYEFVLHQFKNKERVIQCPHDECKQEFAYPVIKNILQSMPKSKEEAIENEENEKEEKEEEKLSVIGKMLLDIK